MTRWLRRTAHLGRGAAVAAALVWSCPAGASAETPVGKVVMYEVNEALRLLKGHDPNHDGDQDDAAKAFVQRMAKASLLGKDVKAPKDSPFAAGTFVEVDATSNVPVTASGIPGPDSHGPLTGVLTLLVDLDPTRQSLDTLAVTASFAVRGELDLSTAAQGFASMHGQWRQTTAKNDQNDEKGQKRAGTFKGIFLIPFRLPGDPSGTYFYLDLDASLNHGTCPTSPVPGLCPLASDEFTLGFPVTKALATFFE